MNNQRFIPRLELQAYRWYRSSCPESLYEDERWWSYMDPQRWYQIPDWLDDDLHKNMWTLGSEN